MQLHDQRYEEIKAECVNMLEHVHATSYPLNAVDILRTLGAILIPYSEIGDKVKEATSEAFSKDGFQLTKNGILYVFFNNTRGSGRTKYTLFHESGHFWLKHAFPSELAESEADFFAKYCLAPPPVVHYFGCSDFYQLMDRFELSQEAAIYAWQYYCKWLKRGEVRLSKTELRLYRLLGIESDGTITKEVRM